MRGRGFVCVFSATWPSHLGLSFQSVIPLSALLDTASSVKSLTKCLLILRIHSSEGLTHLAVFYLVGAGYLLNLTLRHGMVWYIFSMSIITVNDIMAYMAGFFIGSTPLIVLSPKKTVEGYIGGGLATLVIGPLLAISLQEMTSLTAAWEGTAPLGSEFYSGLLSPFVMHCFAISVFAR